jgi:hypothetical protein
MLSCMAAIGLLLSVSRISETEAETLELQDSRFARSAAPTKAT